MNFSIRPLIITLLVALSLSLGILFWIREQEAARLNEAVIWATASVEVDELLGDPFEPRADFSASESVVARIAAHPMIRSVVLTKRIGGRPDGEDEIPIVPYDLLARSMITDRQWQDDVTGWRRLPLRLGDSTFGYLYCRLDRSVLRALNLAIVAAVLGIGLSSAAFFVRSPEVREIRPHREFMDHPRELVRLDRLALAGYFAAGIFHELKRPVLEIRHNLEDLRETLGDLAGASVGFRRIREQIDTFLRRLNDSRIEQFIRSDRLGWEEVDVNDAIDTALHMASFERGGVRVIRRFSDHLSPVPAPPYRLVQVFAGIILNAYQELQGKGDLEIETTDLGVMTEVRITDNGPGLDPALIPRIFEPFYSTKSEAEGSGMGLTIARLIVEDLGGKISVDSQHGGPTTFRILLPCGTSLLRGSTPSAG